MDMFYCTLIFSKNAYEQIKDIPEIQTMATEVYQGKSPNTIELCNYEGDIIPAEWVLQELGIPYEAFLDKTDGIPALKRVFDGVKVKEKEIN